MRRAKRRRLALLASVATMAAAVALLARAGGERAVMLPALRGLAPAAPPPPPTRDRTPDPGVEPAWGVFAAQSRPLAHAQGVRGRVHDQAHAPLVGVAVWLVPVSGAAFAAGIHAARSGRSEDAPILLAMTDARGEFALGIADPQLVERCDVWVVAELLAEKRHGGLRVMPGVWLDLGAIEVVPGVPVSGRVTRRRDGAPIHGALVSFLPYAQMQLASFVPGREHGITARTDAAGEFRLMVSPLQALLVSAAAPGFARAERVGVHLDGEAENRFDFALDAGAEIGGSVIDRRGAPVPAARVTATPRGDDPVTPLVAWSDAQGRFELGGLRPGDHRLEIAHASYAPEEVAAVAAGTRGAVITLKRMGSVRVQATGSDGRVLREFEVALRTETDSEDAHAFADLPVRRVRAGGDGFATVDGLPPASRRWIVQVMAPGHAHGFSRPFSAGLDAPPAAVRVELDAGGRIAGTVHAADGTPLADVGVQTLPAVVGDEPDAMHAVFRIPTRISEAFARSDARGAFRLQLLHPGTYVLRLQHPEHCTLVLEKIEVRRGETVELTDLRLLAGTTVAGTVRFAGVAPRHAKVTISRRISAGEQGVPVYGEGLVARDGSFAIARRFPPGHYRIAAGSVARPEPGEPLIGGRLLFEGLVLDGSKRRVELELSFPPK